MPRVNLWLPAELAMTVNDQLPAVNMSQVLQEQLRALLGCKHDRIVCAACNAEVEKAKLVEDAKSAFYSQLLWELEDLIARDGTAEGAARVAKSVALAHRLPVADRPLPRPSRSQRKRALDQEWFNRQAAAGN